MLKHKTEKEKTTVLSVSILAAVERREARRSKISVSRYNEIPEDYHQLGGEMEKYPVCVCVLGGGVNGEKEEQE